MKGNKFHSMRRAAAAAAAAKRPRLQGMECNQTALGNV